MQLDISCAQGKTHGWLQITDDGHLQFASRKAIRWRVPCRAIQSFGAHAAPFGFLAVTIYTAKSEQTIGAMPEHSFKQLLTHFPNVPVTSGPRVWYFDADALTHIETYTNQQHMQREVENAYRNGWVLQGQSSTTGQGNVGAMVTGALIAGVAGAVIGGLAGSPKTTLTFVRSPEWLKRHQRPTD